jgi:hypothetical protein
MALLNASIAIIDYFAVISHQWGEWGMGDAEMAAKSDPQITNNQ